MFAVINNSQFFTAAHQLAKATRSNFASYREAFAAALREGHKAVKEVASKCAEIIKAAIVKFAPRMSKASKSVVAALLALGGNRWTKAGHDRVYFNNANDLVGIETTYYKTGNLSSVAEIAAAPTREIRKYRDWLDFWCRSLKWEYSQEYRIARDACNDELDARSRQVEREIR